MCPPATLPAWPAIIARIGAGVLLSCPLPSSPDPAPCLLTPTEPEPLLQVRDREHRTRFLRSFHGRRKAGRDVDLLGPLFKFNPSVSFHVKCRRKDEVDAIREGLSRGGKVLMTLGSYPFSERYGWVEDKYGLSWQVIFAGEREMRQRTTPNAHVRGQGLRQDRRSG